MGSLKIDRPVRKPRPLVAIAPRVVARHSDVVAAIRARRIRVAKVLAMQAAVTAA